MTNSLSFYQSGRYWVIRFKIDYERSGLRLWGWFGHPEIARNQVDQQYFYLNGRAIRDKQVNHAIRMATQDHHYTGKHAVYVLFLEMDVSHVDVNVHPAKHEVRFRQARDVHDFIFSALVQACDGRDIWQQTTLEQEIQEQGESIFCLSILPEFHNTRQQQQSLG